MLTLLLQYIIYFYFGKTFEELQVQKVEFEIDDYDSIDEEREVINTDMANSLRLMSKCYGENSMHFIINKSPYKMKSRLKSIPDDEEHFTSSFKDQQKKHVESFKSYINYI